MAMSISGKMLKASKKTSAATFKLTPQMCKDLNFQLMTRGLLLLVSPIRLFVNSKSNNFTIRRIRSISNEELMKYLKIMAYPRSF